MNNPTNLILILLPTLESLHLFFVMEGDSIPSPRWYLIASATLQRNSPKYCHESSLNIPRHYFMYILSRSTNLTPQCNYLARTPNAIMGTKPIMKEPIFLLIQLPPNISTASTSPAKPLREKNGSKGVV